MHIRISRASAALLAGVLATGLIGCSADGQTGGGTDGAREPVTILHSNSAIAIGNAETYVPLALGYLEDNGLDAEVITGGGTQQVLAALVGGQADVVVANADPLVIAKETQGLPIKSIYAINHHMTYSVQVPADSPIQGPADLKGKTVGVFSMASASVQYLEAKLAEAGLTGSDVTMVPIGAGQQAAEAVRSGQVDAFVLWSAANAEIENLGISIRMLPRAEWEGSVISFNLIATEATIREKSDLLQKVARAFAQAAYATATNPDAAVMAYWEQYPESRPAEGQDSEQFQKDRKVVEATIADWGVAGLDAAALEAYQWGTATDQEWQNELDYLVQVGLVSQPPRLSDLYTNEFAEYANDFDRAEAAAVAKQFLQAHPAPAG